QAPTAAFTSTAADLVAAFDASTSADADGTVASYAWTFGDQTSGTGQKPSHTYAAAGTYPVTLTVTDDDGATGTVTRDVTVTAAPAGPVVVARDTFARTVTGGWGTAETGGPWSVTGGAANFSVAGGVGRVQTATAGATSTALLNGAASDDTDLRFSFALDKATTGGGVFFTAIGRRVDASTDYRSTTKVLSDGRVNLSVVRRTGGTETSLQAVTVAGLTAAPAARLQVRVQVRGTGTTTVRAKVWLDGTAEPTAWQVSRTDTTAALQAAGSTGFSMYLSGSATNAPLVASLDDVVVQRGVPG
ncbi:PKD domain-containing protein, partial [Kineococcus sp. R8]|uniref:PKD domain-containing protein n=1 Tax=Kineococcus siccus TaxID=2696567 RepID=UPI001412EE80